MLEIYLVGQGHFSSSLDAFLISDLLLDCNQPMSRKICAHIIINIV